MKVQVLLPKIFNFPFTYNLDHKKNYKKGDVVEIPFGSKKEIGVIWNNINSVSKKIKIKILELPTDDQVASKKSIDNSDPLKNPLNVVVKNLTEDQKKQIDIYDHGVLVEQISPGPAQESGIRKGDALLLLDNIKIKDVEHFNKLVKELPKDRSISVLIQRRDGPVFLALKLDKQSK